MFHSVGVAAAAVGVAAACCSCFCFCSDNHEIDTYLPLGPWGPPAMRMLNPPS